MGLEKGLKRPLPCTNLFFPDPSTHETAPKLRLSP